MTTVALIANGEMDRYETLRSAVLKHQRIVAVDGGLRHCQAMKIEPHLMVGDFDSCPEKLMPHYASVPKITLLKDKDQTDLEVAIEHEFKQGAEEITLFGAWGGRIDHSLTNALLLGRHPGKVRLETTTELVFAIHSRAEIPCQIGQTLSLIPIYGPVTGITTTGLKWELKDGKLDQNFVGISNIALQKRVSLSINRGILLCCLSKHLPVPL